MRLTTQQLRQIIQEELQEQGWRGGGNLRGEEPMPLDEVIDDSPEGLAARVKELEGIAFALEHTSQFEDRLLKSQGFKHAVSAIIGDWKRRSGAPGPKISSELGLDEVVFNPDAKHPAGGYDTKHEGPFDTEQQAQDVVRRKTNKAMEGFEWETQQDAKGKFFAVELEVI